MVYTAQQIQDAIAASRAQGYSEDDIRKGALANFGVDVSGYMAPPAPVPSFGTPQSPDYTAIANHTSYLLNNGASPQDVFATMDRAGVDAQQLIQAVQQAHAGDGLYAQAKDYASAAAANNFTGQNWTNLNNLSTGVRTGYDALDGMMGNNVPTTGGLLTTNTASPTGYAAAPGGGTTYTTGTPGPTPAVPGGGRTTPSAANPQYGIGLNSMLNTLGGGASLQERSGSLNMPQRDFTQPQASQALTFAQPQAPTPSPQVQAPNLQFNTQSQPLNLPPMQGGALNIERPQQPMQAPPVMGGPLNFERPQAPQQSPMVQGGPLNIDRPMAPQRMNAISGPQGIAAPTMEGYTQSPALVGMFDSLSRQATDTFARNAQAIRSNAGAVGGLGGSRQGVAEGIMGQGVTNALADQSARLLYQDYGDAMNRNLTKYGQDQSFALGQGAQNLQRYATDVTQNLGLAGLDQQRYSTDASFNLGAANAQNQRLANDQQYALGRDNLGQQRYASDIQFSLGQANAQNQRLANDQSYSLGLTNAGNARYATDANFNLGAAQAQNQRLGLQNDYALGSANAMNQRYATDVQSMLGQANALNNRYATDTSYALGQGGLANQRYGMDQNYSLGQAQAQNQRLGLDQNYSLGLGSLQNTADANRNQFATQQRALDQSGLETGAKLYALGQAGDWGPLTNAGNIYSVFGGLNQNASTGGQSGGGWLGALGGALGTAQLGANLGFWGNK